MATLIWNPDLDIGIYEIDTQHRSLVAIANQLCDAIESGREARTVEWILDALLMQIRLHFQTEEKFMRRCGQQDFSSHKREHRQMLKAMRRFMRQYRGDGESVAEELLLFVHRWLEDHLNGEDRLLGEYVRRAAEAVR